MVAYPPYGVSHHSGRSILGVCYGQHHVTFWRCHTTDWLERNQSIVATVHLHRCKCWSETLYCTFVIYSSMSLLVGLGYHLVALAALCGTARCWCLDAPKQGHAAGSGTMLNALGIENLCGQVLPLACCQPFSRDRTSSSASITALSCTVIITTDHDCSAAGSAAVHSVACITCMQYYCMLTLFAWSASPVVWHHAMIGLQ